LDSLGTQFKKVDYSKYIDKTIDELLQVEPLNKTPIRIGTFDEPPFMLSYTKLVYSDKVFILLYPDIGNLKYVNRYSSSLIWDFNLIKKEKIVLIRLFTEDVEMVFSKDYVRKFPH
jgi:L-ribulose-5-phosphate 3-epimerase UlaE